MESRNMRLFYLILAGIFLSACSIQGMVEKSTPESVRADHAAHIDSLLAKDKSRILSAFDLDEEEESVQEQLSGVFDEVPSGKEIRRDYVGFESSTSFGTSDGKSRDISITTEVQTTDGFMTVMGQYALNEKTGECCKLTNLNVQKYDSSPLRDTLESAGKIGRIIGFVFLALIFGLIALFVFLRRRKIKHRQTN